MTDNLLPVNATPLERAISDATGRVGEIPVNPHDLWNPVTCPAHLLPWLAWGLSVDRWSGNGSEARKRTEIAASIKSHRVKGSRASIEDVLARYDELLELVEWFETLPAGMPHTFEIHLPIDGNGGERVTREFAEAIVREVVSVKPARSHFELLQMMTATGTLCVPAAAMMTGFLRMEGPAQDDDSQPWADFLQTENGEPFVLEGSAGYLESA